MTGSQRVTGDGAECEGTRACVHSGMCSSTSDIVTQTVPPLAVPHPDVLRNTVLRHPEELCHIAVDSLTASASCVEEVLSEAVGGA